MKCDDGFIAYINGHEVARMNAPRKRAVGLACHEQRRRRRQLNVRGVQHQQAPGQAAQGPQSPRDSWPEHQPGKHRLPNGRRAANQRARLRGCDLGGDRRGGVLQVLGARGVAQFLGRLLRQPQQLLHLPQPRHRQAPLHAVGRRLFVREIQPPACRPQLASLRPPQGSRRPQAVSDSRPSGKNMPRR